MEIKPLEIKTIIEIDLKQINKQVDSLVKGIQGKFKKMKAVKLNVNLDELKTLEKSVKQFIKSGKTVGINTEGLKKAKKIVVETNSEINRLEKEIKDLFSNEIPSDVFERQLAKAPGIARDTGEKINKELWASLAVDKVKLDRVKKTMSKLSKTLAKDIEGLRVKIDIAKASGNIEKVERLTEELQKKLGKETDLKVDLDKAKSEFTEVGRKIKNLENIGNTTTSRLGRQFDKLGGGLSKSFSKFAGVATGVFAAIGGTSLLSKVIGDSAELEQTRTAFNLLIGDAEKAGKVLDDLAGFSSKTPFKFPEVADGARKLSSVAGVAENELIPVLTSLGDIAASQGKGIDQSVEAFNDAITGEFERLKEFGIRASSSGDDVTFTFKEQETTVKKTKGAIQEYLIELSQAQGVQGAMSEQSKTLNGRISTLKDNFGFLVKSIVGVKTSGDIIEGGVVDRVGRFAGYIGELVLKYKQWGEENPRLASTIGIVTVGIGALATAVLGLGLGITLLGPGLLAIGAFIAPIAFQIAAVTAGITALGVAYKNNLGGFADAVKGVGEAILPVLEGIKDAFLTFVTFLNDKFGDEIKIIFEGIASIFTGFITLFSAGLSTIIGLFTNSSGEMGTTGKILIGIFKGIGEVVKLVFKNIGSVIEFTLGTVGNLFKIFGSIMKGDFSGAFKGVEGIVKNFSTLFKNIIGDTLKGATNIIANFVPKMRTYGENLINSFKAGIDAKVKAVVDSVKAVATKIKNFLGVASPTKEGPLAVDQSKWGENLINSINKGILSKKKDTEKAMKEIADVLGKDIESPEVKSVYDKLIQEQKLTAEQLEKQNKDLINSGYLKLVEQSNAVSDGVDETTKALEENVKQIQNIEEKAIESIDKIKTAIDDLNDSEDDALLSRNQKILEERKKLSEDLLKASDGRSVDKITKIDEQLEGPLSDAKRNRLEDKRLVLIEKIESKLLTKNRLTEKEFELKEKLLGLEKEQSLINQNVTQEQVQERQEEDNQSDTEREISDNEQKRKELEEIQAINEAIRDDTILNEETITTKKGQEYLKDTLAKKLQLENQNVELKLQYKTQLEDLFDYNSQAQTYASEHSEFLKGEYEKQEGYADDYIKKLKSILALQTKTGTVPKIDSSSENNNTQPQNVEVNKTYNFNSKTAVDAGLAFNGGEINKAINQL